ncbi:MAG: hypothetical protein ACK5AJ_04285 [bacterium]
MNALRKSLLQTKTSAYPVNRRFGFLHSEINPSIVIRAITNNSDPFESLNVSIFQGDDSAALINTGPIALPVVNPDSKESPLQGVQLTFMLTPYQIDKETTIKVKATTEREELSGANLKIHVAQP